MSIRKHTTYNLLGAVIPLAVSLVTIPIYLGLIGEARFGVLAIAWLLLGYFGLFDLGLGRATAQRIAAMRDATAAERARTFWTAATLNICLGVVGGLLVWPVASYFFGNLFKVEDALRPEIQAVVPWLVLAVPLVTMASVMGGALHGRERFLELNLMSVAGAVLFQLLPLASAILWGPDLRILLPAAILARLLTVLVLLVRCRHHIFKGYPASFVRSQARELLRFGGWVTVTSFVAPMMVGFDRLLIGALAGAKSVTYYTVPFQLGENSTVISNALSAALFPRFAVATRQEEQDLAYDGLRILATVMTPLVAGGIFLIEPFLGWWISPDFAGQSAQIGQILLLAFWVSGFAKIPFAQLQARGRPDLAAKCHLAELLPYFCMLYLGFNFYGLLGAGLAFALRVLADLALLAGLAGMLPLLFRMLITPALLLTTALAIAFCYEPVSLAWFAAVGLHLLVTMIWTGYQAAQHFKRPNGLFQGWAGRAP